MEYERPTVEYTLISYSNVYVLSAQAGGTNRCCRHVNRNIKKVSMVHRNISINIILRIA